MIKTAIIGVTGFGAVHYQDLLNQCEAGNMTPVAATIINAGEVPQKVETLTKMGCKIFTDFREMFAECRGDIELTMIPTGITWHAPMT
ncbi:MAG: hypothetical protein D6820_11140, partial [Lentisphaerae bacterium]